MQQASFVLSCIPSTRIQVDPKKPVTLNFVLNYSETNEVSTIDVLILRCVFVFELVNSYVNIQRKSNVGSFEN